MCSYGVQSLNTKKFWDLLYWTENIITASQDSWFWKEPKQVLSPDLIVGLAMSWNQITWKCFFLLAMIIQPRIPWHLFCCQDMLLAVCPGSFPVQLFPSLSLPCPPPCKGSFLPGCRTLNFSFLKLIKFLLACSSSLSRSLLVKSFY